MLKTWHDDTAINYNYLIEDGFICPATCNDICNTITDQSFDWHYTRAVDYELLDHDKHDEDNWQFIHVLDNFGNRTPGSEKFQPLVDRIDPEIIYRLKINFCPKHNIIKPYGFHVDTKLTPGLTSILYLNDCNGKTLLRCPDGVHEVESVAGRLLTFDNRIFHTGTTATDNHRFVINFNFFPRLTETTEANFSLIMLIASPCC